MRGASRRQHALITGGAGYIGSAVSRRLLQDGWDVRVLDVLLHGQSDVADALRAEGVDVRIGDLRDADAVGDALDGIDVVVHLAAIVGDPAVARDPATATAVNLQASEALIEAARDAGIAHFVFASTCSNYGRMADPDALADEGTELRPVSLYAEQKVAIERRLLAGDLPATCLRLATIHGVSSRMRFDLTVNEFTRDLWFDRDLEIFGAQYWRPYLHVSDAASAIARVLAAPPEAVVGQVFNVGRSDENHTKRDLIDLISVQVPKGRVHYVHRDEDPRDYRVAFDKIRDKLGFVPERRVVDGIGEVVAALDAGCFEDPFDGRYSNTV
jgi:nucleoside-diphosphate-sugar epimerase